MKAEEVIPKVIKRISGGESLSTNKIIEDYRITRNTFNNKFKAVREEFYSAFIDYDKSTETWVRLEPLFLEKMLLTPEEAVVLTAIKRNSKTYGSELTSTVEGIVDNYVKRTKNSVFKQDILEIIDEDLEIIFAQLKYAIDNNKKIKFKFNDVVIIMYPYKIINLEYYWYILGYEEYSEYWMDIKNKPERSQKVKTFTIAHVRSLELLYDNFSYDFSKTQSELIHAMNAFFDVAEESRTIELLVIHWLEDYITRAPYFSGWKRTPEYEEVKNEETGKNEKYFVYEVKSTNKYFQDIIPTIQKYIPYIRIRSDEDIKDAIFKKIEQFIQAHN